MLPTFLGIGAQRAGTTRLHKLLAAHPDVQMPSTGVGPLNKELHYFNARVRSHDLAWYARQLAPPPGEPPKPVRGEITPAYSMLDRPVVAEIRRVLPDVRLVFIIRNPIDRIWSALLMTLARWREKRHVELPSPGRLASLSERPTVVLRTDYERTIDIWTSVFGRDALLVIPFEEQFRAPDRTLVEIFRHIGANPEWKPSKETLEERTWSSPPMECPPFLRYHLARRWLPRVESLNRRLDGRVDQWVDELREAASNAPGTWSARSHGCQLRSTLPNAAESAFFLSFSLLLRRRIRQLR